MQGHDPITAATVNEALASLEGAGAPSHLLLDMNLPDGFGTTVLRRIRTAKLPIKVAVLSGSLDNRLIDEARSLEPDALFTKPPNWDKVLDWIVMA
jgi:CheY-like chemotaxis protein